LPNSHSNTLNDHHSSNMPPRISSSHLERSDVMHVNARHAVLCAYQGQEAPPTTDGDPHAHWE